MKKRLPILALGLVLLGSLYATAAEKTVRLSVPDMFCASCPFIVKTAISRVNGVLSVEARLDDRTALVTFDDAITSLEAITKATTDVGYESSLLEAAAS